MPASAIVPISRCSKTRCRENILPQTFQVALILKGKETTVQIIELSDTQTADIPLSLGGEYDEAILVVTGTTRFTRELANYSIEIK